MRRSSSESRRSRRRPAPVARRGLAARGELTRLSSAGALLEGPLVLPEPQQLAAERQRRPRSRCAVPTYCSQPRSNISVGLKTIRPIGNSRPAPASPPRRRTRPMRIPARLWPSVDSFLGLGPDPRSGSVAARAGDSCPAWYRSPRRIRQDHRAVQRHQRRHATESVGRVEPRIQLDAVIDRRRIVRIATDRHFRVGSAGVATICTSR